MVGKEQPERPICRRDEQVDASSHRIKDTIKPCSNIRSQAQELQGKYLLDDSQYLLIDRPTGSQETTVTKKIGSDLKGRRRKASIIDD